MDEPAEPRTEAAEETAGDLEPFDPAEIAAELQADACQQRLWIRTLTPILQLRSTETDPSDKVQEAFDLLYIATCARLKRILRSDLQSGRG
jgi:hypothetical protein